MIGHVKLVSFYMTEDVREAVANCISEIAGIDYSERKKNRTDTLKGLYENETADVVIYQMDGESEEEVEALSSFISEHSQSTDTILISDQSDNKLTRQLMRAGAVDVLPFPMDSYELGSLLRDAISEKRRRIATERGSLAGAIAFMGAKGGSGSTTLAVNVAYDLATKHNMKVALVDFDMQFGDVALYLDLRPSSTVADALRQAHRLDPVFLKALMTHHKSGLDVLASCGSLYSASDVSSDEVVKLLEVLVETYDYVVIDLPDYIDNSVIEVLRFSEYIMLVIQNSLSAIKNANLLLHHFPSMSIDVDKVQVINNRAKSSGASVDIAKLKEALGHERIHRVRNDFKEITSAEDVGESLLQHKKRAKAAKDVAHLAESIWQQRNGG